MYEGIMGNSTLSWSSFRQSCALATLLFVVLLLILLPFKIDREHQSFAHFVKTKQITPSYIELLGKSLSLHDIIDFNKSSLAPFQLDSSRLMLPQGAVLSA
ncbi:MAG: GGDEF domain-containing protein, partial [Shewanella oncorhynchi]